MGLLQGQFSHHTGPEGHSVGEAGFTMSCLGCSGLRRRIELLEAGKEEETVLKSRVQDLDEQITELAHLVLEGKHTEEKAEEIPGSQSEQPDDVKLEESDQGVKVQQPERTDVKSEPALDVTAVHAEELQIDGYEQSAEGEALGRPFAAERPSTELSAGDDEGQPAQMGQPGGGSSGITGYCGKTATEEQLHPHQAMREESGRGLESSQPRTRPPPASAQYQVSMAEVHARIEAILEVQEPTEAQMRALAMLLRLEDRMMKDPDSGRAPG